MLLKQQAVNSHVGFQSTLLGKYKVVETSKPLVQILHVHSNHWLTITTAYCAPGEVRIYDSAAQPYISLSLKQQICSVLHPLEHKLKFIVVDMQHQMDTCSCGLFAIAVATELVTGGNPTACRWDVSKMRSHLISCFEKRELTRFPLSRERRVHPGSLYRKIVTEKIYCRCRMPNDPRRPMIQCNPGCKEWFHLDCCGVVDIPKRNKCWTCNNCSS